MKSSSRLASLLIRILSFAILKEDSMLQRCRRETLPCEVHLLLHLQESFDQRRIYGDLLRKKGPTM